MRVFVEGGCLLRERSGVGQYTKALIEALLPLRPADRFTIFGFFFAGKRFAPPIPPRENLDYRLIRYFPGKGYSFLFRKLAAPPVDLLLGARPDLCFFPNFVRFPLALREPSVIVIYDLSFLLHGRYVAPRNREYLKEFVPRSIRKAERIVTISENSRREIVENYRVAPERVAIVPPAVDPGHFRRRPEEEVREVLARHGITKPYILFTSTIEPRKNILGLLEAYAALPRELRSSHGLVLVGGKGWLDEEIHRRLGELSHLDVRLTGYVGDRDLPALYSGASVFVYPSFYEGFGMPPLEAMACGVPVVTSRNSSLPEVVGDAGILVDPGDPSAIAQAIQEVLCSPARAADLSRRGLERSRAFRWDESARRLATVFEEAAGVSGSS